MSGEDSDTYTIEMVKTTINRFSPSNFQLNHNLCIQRTNKVGYIASFPGPTIYARPNRPVKIRWINNIDGPHILPIELNHPFMP